MKWVAFAGEAAGFLSSLALAWAYSTPAQSMRVVMSNDQPKLDRALRWRATAAKLGFCALSVAFLLQAVATLYSS